MVDNAQAACMIKIGLTASIAHHFTHRTGLFQCQRDRAADQADAQHGQFLDENRHRRVLNRASQNLGDAAQLAHQVLQLFRIQCLVGVAPCLARLGMHFHQQTVGTRSNRSA